MERNLYRRKRTYEEAFGQSSLPLREGEEEPIQLRKSIKILEQRTFDHSNKKPEFDEETMRLISAIKAQQEQRNSSSHNNNSERTVFNTPNLFNPFATINNKDTNAPTNYNSIFGGNNMFSGINFNFNSGQNINPVFEAEEREKAKRLNEEEGDDGEIEYNPEEEIQIKPSENTSTLPLVTLKSDSEKVANYAISQLSVYDFVQKVYKDKGQGKLSLELFRGKTNKGIVVFRVNDGMPILFQGNVFPGMTSVDESKKPNAVIAVMNKVFSDKNDKLENNALKIKYGSNKEMLQFIEDFKKFTAMIKDDSKTTVKTDNIDTKPSEVNPSANLVNNSKRKDEMIVQNVNHSNVNSKTNPEVNIEKPINTQSDKKILPNTSQQIANPFALTQPILFGSIPNPQEKTKVTESTISENPKPSSALSNPFLSFLNKDKNEPKPSFASNPFAPKKPQETELFNPFKLQPSSLPAPTEIPRNDASITQKPMVSKIFLGAKKMN